MFLTESFLLSLVIAGSLLIWYFIFVKPDFNENVALIAIFVVFSYLFIFLGSWLWMFWSQPTIVSIFWFLLLFYGILLVVSSLAKFAKNVENLPNQVLLYTFIGVGVLMLTKLVILIGVVLFVGGVANKKEKYRFSRASRNTLIVLILLVIMILGSLAIYTPKDNANYYDDLLTYDSGLPFNTKIDGDFLRVVDKELAQSIMLKSNLFGSNTKITDIHLGKINGSTYWIGAVSFSGSKIFRPDMNMYMGFMAVDFKDPQLAPIKIDEKFYVGTDLVLGRQLDRVIYDFNYNYIVADNVFYTQAPDNHMRLMVPYAVQASPLLGQKNAGFVTQEIQKDGGVLELGADGTVLHDYKDRSTVPDYALVQLYSEHWLKREIDWWGRSMTSPHTFGTFTHFGGWLKSQWLMGIDDDVHVVIDPDTERDIQYIMLDSSGSDNQILRGAIKVNATGMFYYDWSTYAFIDTNTAHEHGETVLTDHFGNSVHGYTTLLPILYPIKQNPHTMHDYAYVMPLLFRNVRFGGIVVTDPQDKTGVHSSVAIVDLNKPVNISQIVLHAINQYLLTSSTSISNSTGNFTIATKTNYVSEGNTIYVMNGNFTTGNITTYETILFRQDLIDKLNQWILVVNAKIGDVLIIELSIEEGVFVATSVSLP